MERRIQKVWKTGSSYVLTIPSDIIEKYDLKKGNMIEVIFVDPKKR